MREIGLSSLNCMTGKPSLYIIGGAYSNIIYSVAPVARGLLLLEQPEGLVAQKRSKKSVGFYDIMDYDAEKHGDKVACGAYRDTVDKNRFFVHTVNWLLYQVRNSLNYHYLTNLVI